MIAAFTQYSGGQWYFIYVAGAQIPQNLCTKTICITIISQILLWWGGNHVFCVCFEWTNLLKIDDKISVTENEAVCCCCSSEGSLEKVPRKTSNSFIVKFLLIKNNTDRESVIVIDEINPKTSAYKTLLDNTWGKWEGMFCFIRVNKATPVCFTACNWRKMSLY